MLSDVYLFVECTALVVAAIKAGQSSSEVSSSPKKRPLCAG